VALVFIVFVWRNKVGVYIDQNENKVKIKKHGYRAKSLFKQGLEYISNILLNPQKQSKLMFSNFCHVVRYYLLFY
jgi:hypothetical protein